MLSTNSHFKSEVPGIESIRQLGKTVLNLECDTVVEILSKYYISLVSYHYQNSCSKIFFILFQQKAIQKWRRISKYMF
jgi:hypothetical protein